MELNRYIRHPEQLDRETLYDLRCYVALYPYHQAARLLMLQNLYLLHDPSFGEELKQAALYISDRTALFNLLESKHYQLGTQQTKKAQQKDRTDMLIDGFLKTVAPEPEPEVKKKRRKPTASDATVDYAAYLLETYGYDDDYDDDDLDDYPAATDEQQHAKTLIDNFLENEGGKIVLNDDETAAYTPHNEVALENDKDELEEDYFTEALAKIYIKQGNYSKALEIIQRLNLLFPKKSAYFADQMRFLEKIILINQ